MLLGLSHGFGQVAIICDVVSFKDGFRLVSGYELSYLAIYACANHVPDCRASKIMEHARCREVLNRDIQNYGSPSDSRTAARSSVREADGLRFSRIPQHRRVAFSSRMHRPYNTDTSRFPPCFRGLVFRPIRAYTNRCRSLSGGSDIHRYRTKHRGN
jgi:hypothetical protein